MNDRAANRSDIKGRATWSWALYDWANSAFAATVIAGFFPVFFKKYWASGLAVTDSTFWLGLTSSGTNLLIVVLAPLLGALADHLGAKKRLLALFAFVGIAATASLPTVAAGAWPLALLCYALGLLGFTGGNVFYDALLLQTSPPGQLDRVSALGFALGYLGGGILLALNILTVLHPAWFGLSGADQAVRVAFLAVAVWWAVFSVPLFWFVFEARPRTSHKVSTALRNAYYDLGATFHHLRAYRPALLFLLAYWLYIDGVDTIVVMAVDYGLAIGFGAKDLLSALLLTQLVGFPAALLFGRIGEKWGPKRGIWLAILVYSLAVFWAGQMRSTWEFYALAVTIGLVQGGIQALSRSLYARLIPADKAGEFFGFYNMLGKFAVVLGPIVVGWTAAATGNPRAGILSLLGLFLLGALILRRVDVAAGTRTAAAGARNQSETKRTEC